MLIICHNSTAFLGFIISRVLSIVNSVLSLLPVQKGDTAVAKTPLVRWKFSVYQDDSCGARDFLACRWKSRPLRPHRLASSATGGASALRLPTSPAQSASIWQLSAASAGDQQESKRKHHPFGWCFFLAPPVGLEPTTLRLTAACSTD